MIDNNNISLNAVLKRFRSHLKTAEEEGDEEKQPVIDAATAPRPGAVDAASAQEPEEECDEDECCEDGECDETDCIEQKAKQLSNAHDEALDAAEALKAMASDYIEKHDDSIQKEAAVFGQIFADAAMGRFSKYAQAEYEDENMFYDYYLQKQAEEAEYQDFLCKQAQEEAYNECLDMLLEKEAADESAYLDYIFEKVAEEAYDATASQVAAAPAPAPVAAAPASADDEDDDEAEIAAAKAISDAASAAKALVDHLDNQDEEDEDDEDGGESAGEAQQQGLMQDAYNSMAQQGAGLQAPTVDPSVAQGVTDHAVAMQQQPQY